MVTDPDKRTVLFVDDRAKRIDWAIREYWDTCNLIIAPNVPEALRAISSTKWKRQDLISLDHDLNGGDFQDPEDPTSGMEIIRYMDKLDYMDKFRRLELSIRLHSGNKFAAHQMASLLSSRGVFCHESPINYEEE